MVSKSPSRSHGEGSIYRDGISVVERVQHARAFERCLLHAVHDGEPVHPHSISQAFERIARNAGLTVIRFHDLRHTHATLLIKEGVPVKVVSERLGHATTAFTIETYQHALPSMQADAAHLFAALVDPSTGEDRWKTRKKSA
jgi:integrase